MKGIITRLITCLNNVAIDVFRSTSLRVLDGKIRSFDKNTIFCNEDMAEHFAHSYLGDIASQNVVKGFIIDRIQFIEQVLDRDAISEDSFIDIGDSDGIFLKALGKNGFSANMSEMGVKNIHKKGIEAIRCDAEHLPFKDNSIDHILFFQIFEHLPNPIMALLELNRVAAKSVFLSIPYMSKTNIHRHNYLPDQPLFENHIFEFDDQDFRKIISHAGFAPGHHSIVEVIRPFTIKERYIFLLWNLQFLIRKEPEYKYNQNDLFAGCFKKFSIYHLVKKS